MKYSVRSGKKYQVEIDKRSDILKEINVQVGKKKYRLSIKEVSPDGRIKSIEINNKILPVNVERRANGFPSVVQVNGVNYDVDIDKVESTRYRPKSTNRNISGDVFSNLPGQIMTILVKEGDSVKKGQPLLILESMKMENEMLSPKNGVVRKIHVTQNQVIMKNHLMIEVG